MNTETIDAELQTLLTGSRRRLEAIDHCGRAVTEETRMLGCLTEAVQRSQAARLTLLTVMAAPEATPARMERQAVLAGDITAALADMRKPGGALTPFETLARAGRT